MSKQLTPIGKAIEWCDNELSMNEMCRDKYPEEDYFFIKNTVDEFKRVLQSLLPDEKQFAKDAFYMGEGNTKIGDFDKFFYKQYEDEKE